MRRRTKFDLALVLGALLFTYTEMFGWADPIANLSEILGLFEDIDGRAYIVIGGVLGILFVAYLVAYLPKKQSKRSVRQRNQ